MARRPRALHVRRLGRVPYRAAWDLQRRLVAERRAGGIEDTVLLLEHDPVVTLGRHGGRQSLRADGAALAAAGIELVRSDRGGDATYHGPGQLVGYPIVDLRDLGRNVRRYVWALEETMLRTVSDHGLAAGRLDGVPGAWLRDPDRKIGAVGARVSRWITHHGFALNVNTDLEHFALIVPCGIRGKGVTSMACELGEPLAFEEVADRVVGHLARLQGRAPVEAVPGPGDLDRDEPERLD